MNSIQARGTTCAPFTEPLFLRNSPKRAQSRAVAWIVPGTSASPSFSDRLSHHHLQNIEHEDHNIRTGMAYTELFTSCEKLGDHLVQVSEALAGRI